MEFVLLLALVLAACAAIKKPKKAWLHLTAAALAVVLLAGCSTAAAPKQSQDVRQSQKAETKKEKPDKTAASSKAKAESKKKAEAKAAEASKKAAAKKAAAQAEKKAQALAAAKKQAAACRQQTQSLASLTYNGVQTVNVNGGRPTFSAADLSTQKGAWQHYGDLDNLNRATAANALLSKSLMPTVDREGQTFDPTGWHNKRIASGYLYNRSHLIGYQLTGQNNNPKNLMTGTRSLNSPEMLRYEDDIAYFLKTHPSNFIRYQVVPIFKGNNLLASGVHMQAQSVGASGISFNIYIFNVEQGVTLNYADGTSVVSRAETAASSSSRSQAPAQHHQSSGQGAGAGGDMNTASTGKIIGNKNSKIYHVPGQSGYRMNSSNAVYFNTEQEAIAAGYRKSKR